VWVTVVALQILLNDAYKLNHCKEIGAKLGRRFLKQPAEKLKAVFVVWIYLTKILKRYNLMFKLA